nr:lipid droplet-associated hydrolase isoform X2 [Bactrocera oleae]
MKESFITISGGPTHVITWGRWIEEPLDDVPEIVICIPGNPGLVGFYTEFLQLLYEQLGEKIPVWIIGHLGHEEPSKDRKTEVPCLKGNEKIFDLDGQLYHKKEFIQRFVPRNTKIHLIGHSIGAWMSVCLTRRTVGISPKSGFHYIQFLDLSFHCLIGYQNIFKYVEYKSIFGS